jgi:hypothetical protein
MRHLIHFQIFVAGSRRIQAILILPEEITAVIPFRVTIHFTRNRLHSTSVVSTEEEYYFFCPLSKIRFTALSMTNVHLKCSFHKAKMAVGLK